MSDPFNIIFESNTLKIKLSGKLDASNAPALNQQLLEFKGKGVKRLVFLAKDLDYLASAGIRVMIFSIQEILEPGNDAYLIAPNDSVLSVLKMTGVDASLVIQDEYQG